MPTIMRWYGAHISRRDDCSVCSVDEMVLDTGENIEEMLDELNNN